VQCDLCNKASKRVRLVVAMLSFYVNADRLFSGFNCVTLFLLPDRHAHATEEEKKANEVKFKEVGEAYAILSDPKKR